MTTTVSCPGVAAKLRKLADKMPAKIDNLRRPMTQKSTPKRQREYASRCIDGDNLERGRLAMLALADAWERGDVPAALTGVTTKDAICALVRHGIGSTGYYNVHSTRQYADQSEAGKALQALLDASMGKETQADQKTTQEKRDLEGLIDEIRFANIPGFFPTPAAVIELMLVRADLWTGQVVLEPSAGIGSICDTLRERGIEPLVCEIWPSLRDILAAKGYKFYGRDFLECAPINDGPDRIIMNPPFERGQDMAHIRHAFSILKKGGRLVSIVSTGPFFRQEAKAVEFRQWLEDADAQVFDLPDGSFDGATAFRSTGISSKMIVVNKRSA